MRRPGARARGSGGARSRSCHEGKMSDTVIAEGAAKLRDGKKVWNRRMCVCVWEFESECV